MSLRKHDENNGSPTCLPQLLVIAPSIDIEYFGKISWKQASINHPEQIVEVNRARTLQE